MTKYRPVLLLSFLAACTAGVEGDLIEPNLFDDKTDGFSNVIEGGPLAFGGEALGIFDEDFQFYSYTFDAVEDAEITAEITQRGSSRSLDTTLFIYRLDDDEGPVRIGLDDDEGWGRLSRIEDFRFFQSGEYALVVGTKGAAGRGDFRLTLTCLSGECAPAAPPVEACPSALRADIRECVLETSSEFDFEVPLDEVIRESCGTSRDITWFFEDRCATSSASWCNDAAVVDVCMNVAQRDLFPSPTRATRALDAVGSPELDAFIDAASGEFSRAQAAVLTYETERARALTLAEFMGDARERLEGFGPGLFADIMLDVGAADAARVHRASDSFGALLDSLGLDIRDAEFGVAETDEFQWNHGDCHGSMMVAHFPDAGVVIQMQVVGCFG